MKRAVLTLLLTGLLSGCAYIQTAPETLPVSTITPYATHAPLSTATTQPTIAATSTTTARGEVTPAIILQAAAPSATPTLITLERALPKEAIRILQPGPASHVRSPFLAIGRAGPAYLNRVFFELKGEDGRLIMRTYRFLNAIPGNAGTFRAKLEFTIPGVSEMGRLEVYMESRRDGQYVHMGSVDLLLLSVGRPLIHAALDGVEQLAIFSPRPDAVIEGDRVTVRGAGWNNSGLPLVVVIQDHLGNTISEVETELLSPGPGQLGTFEVEVPFAVTVWQNGRILVMERSSTIPGYTHISGIDVNLKP